MDDRAMESIGSTDSVIDRSRSNRKRSTVGGPLQETSRTTYPGLANDSRSNLCFLNSVIQALASITDLYRYLIQSIDHDLDDRPTSSDPQHPSSASSSQSVIISLIDLIRDLNSPRRKRSIVRSTRLIRSLVSIDPNSSNLFDARQQDAHELMISIIQSIDRQAKPPSINQPSNGLAELIETGDRSNPSHRSRFEPKLDRRSARSPFRGLMANRIACATCRSSAVIRHSPADHLSLHLPHSLSCTIEDCLKEYTSLELLEEYVCRKCSLIEAQRRFRFELDRLSSQQQQQKKKKKEPMIKIEPDGVIEGEAERKEEEEEEEEDSSRPRSKRKQRRIQELKSHLNQISSAIELDLDLDPDLERSLEPVWSQMATKQTILRMSSPFTSHDRL